MPAKASPQRVSIGDLEIILAQQDISIGTRLLQRLVFKPRDSSGLRLTGVAMLRLVASSMPALGFGLRPSLGHNCFEFPSLIRRFGKSPDVENAA